MVEWASRSGDGHGCKLVLEKKGFGFFDVKGGEGGWML